MKRSKQVFRGPRDRDSGDEHPGFSSTPKPPEPQWNWDEQVGNQPDGSFIPYVSKATFQRAALIQHPTFGKGVVTRVDGPRIEVLFRDGMKKLVHTG